MVLLVSLDFFKVGKIAQLNTVSHGQAIARSTGLLSRLELVCDSCQLFD